MSIYIAIYIAHSEKISNFVESSFKSSFELLEFLLDEIFSDEILPADLQYYISWYMKCRPNPDPNPNLSLTLTLTPSHFIKAK